LFGTQEGAADLYISNVYIPHVGSPQLHDLSLSDSFMHITNLCQMVHATGGVHLMGGDFNAHVDHVGGEGVNDAGKSLVDLATNCSLKFMLETSQDNPTFHTHRAGIELRSCPDHVLGSVHLHGARCNVSSAVCSGITGSDHYPIEARLSFLGGVMMRPPQLNDFPPRLKWKGNEAQYVNALENAVHVGQFEAAMGMLQGAEVSEAMDEFMQSVTFAAIQSNHVLHTPKPYARTPNPVSKQPWFDLECNQLRRVYMVALRQLGHGHTDTRLKSNAYRSACRKKHRHWREAAISDLIAEAKRDPKTFWRKTSSANAAPPVAATSTDVQACVSYFKSLFYRPQLPPACPAPGSINDESDHVLNAPFTCLEVMQVLSNLRNGVSCGSDGVPGEFFKNAVHRDTHGHVVDNILSGYLVTLFQHMFNVGRVPEKWGDTLLTLAFKGGSRSNWSDYRPIAVVQVIAKVYGLVLNNRLNAWAEDSHVRRPSQAGFRPAHNTHMNTFVLLNIIDKYKHLKQPLFCCFIDLHKAYDSVLRIQAWQRLYDVGVRGRMLHAIVAFYQNISCRIRFSNGLSEQFVSNVGVRQGCPLSPFIFGVFIEELHDRIVAELPGVGATVHNDPDCCIPMGMFADDLNKFANVAQHLQSMLDVLDAFCEEKNMSLSLTKTKIVIFNSSFVSSRDRNFQFTFRGTVLQRVKESKYLGMLMRQGRTVTGMMQHAAKRGQHAVAVVYKKFHQLGVASNIDLKLRLFNAVALPNLTFGCEVWGPWMLSSDWASKAFQSKIEQVRLSFIRVLLSLKSSTPAWNVYRELGAYPLQIFVARQLIKFIHKLWQMPDSTWARKILWDAWWMYKFNQCDNWCARLHSFLSDVGIQPYQWVGDGVVPLYDGKLCESVLKAKCHAVFLQPGLPSKMASYHTQFASEISEGINPLREWQKALYLTLPAPSKRLCLMARFRLSCHHLAVETGRWQNVHIDDRKCPLCNLGSVQDEHHILFVCPALAPIRVNFPVLFHNNRFSHVQKLFQVDRNSDRDWRLVLRETCRYLEVVGGIFKPIQMADPHAAGNIAELELDDSDE
jgi:Reverse transcriptase (RNA-dependent DNA polymerase)/Endonuclease-reverse transcriptase